MPLAVEFNIQDPASFIDADVIERGVKTVAHAWGTRSGCISVCVVDDARMREVNASYLQHDYTTDCLSFVYDRTEDTIDGELILCADYAQREAEAFGWPATTELLLYAIHGTLHLMGMDDATDDGRLAMRQREREFLMRLNIDGAARHGLSDNLNPSE
ncbi:MAG: rRNA maturation RNase YbeY [Pirellulaceae bacterium]